MEKVPIDRIEIPVASGIGMAARDHGDLLLFLPRPRGLRWGPRSFRRGIKADERMRKAPAVAVTSLKAGRGIVASYERGVNSDISKPVDFDEFSKVVSELGLYWLLINRPLIMPGT